MTLYILLNALMVRLDGLGMEFLPNNAFWRFVTWFFGLWPCALITGAATYFLADWQAAIIVTLGWVLWRAPHLGSYWVAGAEHKMFLRATLTVAPSFSALAWFYDSWQDLWVIGAMGVAQVLAYNGVKRLLPEWISGHAFAELATGAAFGASVLVLIF